jgi:hypothetical protein
MTTPSPGADGQTPETRGCLVTECNARTGEQTTCHLPAPLRVLVQLDDGTRVPVEQYVASPEAYTPQPADQFLTAQDDAADGDAGRG